MPARGKAFRIAAAIGVYAAGMFVFPWLVGAAGFVIGPEMFGQSLMQGALVAYLLFGTMLVVTTVACIAET